MLDPTKIQPQISRKKYSASNVFVLTESVKCASKTPFPRASMRRGTLEIVLISAKGLDGSDFLSNIDPYVILTYRSQEHKSTVVEGAGSNPQWNESFLFTVSDSASELNLKIMDKDNFSQDDFLGEATIPLDAVFEESSLPETAYNVVKDQEYCGEIKVALTFTAEQGGGDLGNSAQEEGYGGWKESARDF